VSCRSSSARTQCRASTSSDCDWNTTNYTRDGGKWTSLSFLC
jgi:hypothetical protein